MAISYKDSGVDVTRGYKAVELMKKHVRSTYDGNVLGDIGSFGDRGREGGRARIGGRHGRRGDQTQICFSSEQT